MTQPVTRKERSDAEMLVEATRDIAAGETKPGARPSHTSLMAAAQCLAQAAQDEMNSGSRARAMEINALSFSPSTGPHCGSKT